MAGSKSAFLENVVLNLVLGAQLWTPPSTVYVALSQAVYNEGATGSSFAEITGAGATRVAVANNTTTWPVTTTGQKTNGITITFPAALTAWPEARSFYLLDAAVNGNALYGGDLVTPRTLAPGDTASFGPGSLIIVED